MRSGQRRLLRMTGIVCVMASLPSQAQPGTPDGATTLDQVQVTATRFREPIQEVPESIEQISGEELRARGVNDLRTALSLLGGVTVAPGGDEGPNSAVPGLLGTREADDFLLVVDGVPVGGAFIPQFSTLNLTNVERIEVQRGPASVFYGTTAFAGTINVIHYAAGSAEHQATASYGSYGSAGVSGSAVLSNGAVKQSVSADGSRDRFSDSYSGADRAHLQYRLGGLVADGLAHLDLDGTVQHQKPSSPRPLVMGAFSPAVPIDFNQNPGDGKIDTQRYQLTSGYDREIALGSWGTTLSFTQTQTRLVQGFIGSGDDPGDGDAADGDDDPFDTLLGGLPAIPGTAGAPSTAFAATGFHQKRDLSEAFFDTHVTHRFAKQLITTVGVNDLYGLAHQRSNVFTYALPADGSSRPSSVDGAPVDTSSFSDSRNFAGAYSQTRWTPFRGLGLLGGAALQPHRRASYQRRQR